MQGGGGGCICKSNFLYLSYSCRPKLTNIWVNLDICLQLNPNVILGWWKSFVLAWEGCEHAVKHICSSSCIGLASSRMRTGPWWLHPASAKMGQVSAGQAQLECGSGNMGTCWSGNMSYIFLGVLHFFFLRGWILSTFLFIISWGVRILFESGEDGQGAGGGPRLGTCAWSYLCSQAATRQFWTIWISTTSLGGRIQVAPLGLLQLSLGQGELFPLSPSHSQLQTCTGYRAVPIPEQIRIVLLI